MTDFTDTVDVPLAPDLLPLTLAGGGDHDPVMLSYTTAVAVGPGTAPVVVFVDPLPGGTIVTGQGITIDVTDVDDDLALLCVSAEFLGTDDDETVLRSLAFSPKYAASTLTPITNGYRLVIQRDVGWTSSPTLHVWVTDDDGNVT